jgi:hypothetical protein
MLPVALALGGQPSSAIKYYKIKHCKAETRKTSKKPRMSPSSLLGSVIASVMDGSGATTIEGARVQRAAKKPPRCMPMKSETAFRDDCVVRKPARPSCFERPGGSTLATVVT